MTSRMIPTLCVRKCTNTTTAFSGPRVAVILLLVGGLIVAAAFTGGETQTAMNTPMNTPRRAGAETTGSGGAAQTMPATPRQRP